MSTKKKAGLSNAEVSTALNLDKEMAEDQGQGLEGLMDLRISPEEQAEVQNLSLEQAENLGNEVLTLLTAEAEHESGEEFVTLDQEELAQQRHEALIVAGARPNDSFQKLKAEMLANYSPLTVSDSIRHGRALQDVMRELSVRAREDRAIDKAQRAVVNAEEALEGSTRRLEHQRVWVQKPSNKTSKKDVERGEVLVADRKKALTQAQLRVKELVQGGYTHTDEQIAEYEAITTLHRQRLLSAVLPIAMALAAMNAKAFGGSIKEAYTATCAAAEEAVEEWIPSVLGVEEYVHHMLKRNMGRIIDTASGTKFRRGQDIFAVAIREARGTKENYTFKPEDILERIEAFYDKMGRPLAKYWSVRYVEQSYAALIMRNQDSLDQTNEEGRNIYHETLVREEGHWDSRAIREATEEFNEELNTKLSVTQVPNDDGTFRNPYLNTILAGLRDGKDEEGENPENRRPELIMQLIEAAEQAEQTGVEGFFDAACLMMGIHPEDAIRIITPARRIMALVNSEG